MKFKVGDKVVIRKDLVVCEVYGNWFWSSDREYLKEKDYVVIEEVDDVGDYRINDWWFSDEMIEGLYEEGKEMGVKVGDKVKVIEDAKYCDTIKKGNIVEIDRVVDDFYYAKGHYFNDGSSLYWLRNYDFELVEDDKKYIWYLDLEEGIYFLYDKGLNIIKFNKNGTNAKNIKTGEEPSMLLTEEEAKHSPFFDKFKKHDPLEKWYYIRMKGNEVDYLNLKLSDGEYCMANDDECELFKTKFTEEECNEIIGTSSILYKEKVGE